MRTLAARPLCARCHRPVDSLEEEEDAFREQWILVVRCHGARQRVVISFAEVLGGPVDFGEAFLPDHPELPPATTGLKD